MNHRGAEAQRGKEMRFTANELRLLSIADAAQDQDNSTGSVQRVSRRKYRRRATCTGPLVCRPLRDGFAAMTENERAWAIEQGWIRRQA